jgi:hypothetical protein
MPLPERKLDECAEAADCDLHHLSSRPCCRATTRGVFLKQVNSLRQFGAILLLLVSCGAPAMACITPDTRMTVEERACCRVMKNQCGEMEMPASHDCCKGLPTDINTGALKSWLGSTPRRLAAEVSSLRDHRFKSLVRSSL